MDAKERNSELFDDALDALTALFSDMDVSKEHTKSNFIALVEEIDMMMESL